MAFSKATIDPLKEELPVRSDQLDILDKVLVSGTEVLDNFSDFTDIEELLKRLKHRGIATEQLINQPLTFDIKLVNRTKEPVLITRFILDILTVGLVFRDIEWSGLMSGLSSSASYDVILSPLQGVGQRIFNLSQIVKPAEFDRFTLKLWSRRQPRGVFYQSADKHHRWGDGLLFMTFYSARCSLQTAEGNTYPLGSCALPFFYNKRNVDEWGKSAYLTSPAGLTPPGIDTAESEELTWTLHQVERKIEIPWTNGAWDRETRANKESPVQGSFANPKSQSQKFKTRQPTTSILFLTADPTNAARLRVGEEMREIQEKLQLAKLRDRFTLQQRMSVRPADMSQALLDIQPQIVHFSGHGTADGALCFEDETGSTYPIQPDALAALFEQFASQVNCVLLNACYSEIQASAIAQHIQYVIGMNHAIGDKAAIAFAIGFYQALGAGRTIEESYQLGCVQIRLQGIPEHLTPVLIKKQNAPR